jgi:hypothetical protein
VSCGTQYYKDHKNDDLTCELFDDDTECSDLHMSRNAGITGIVFNAIHAVSMTFLLCMSSREGQGVHLVIVALLELTVAICSFICAAMYNNFLISATTFEIVVSTQSGDVSNTFDVTWKLGFSWILIVITGILSSFSIIINYQIYRLLTLSVSNSKQSAAINSVFSNGGASSAGSAPIKRMEEDNSTSEPLLRDSSTSLPSIHA